MDFGQNWRYWQVELSFKKKSEYESILMKCPGFTNFIKYYPNDYLFLVNMKSILGIIPYSFRSILGFSLTKWDRVLLHFDEKIFSLDLNKIRAFWSIFNEDWIVKNFAHKQVLEKIWKNNEFWKIIKSKPINKILINNIGSIKTSEDGLTVTFSKSKYSFYLTEDMKITKIEDINGEDIHDKFQEEYLYNLKIYKWLRKIKVNRLLRKIKVNRLLLIIK